MKNFFVNLDNLEVEANDEICLAVDEERTVNYYLRTKNFIIAYDQENHITSLETRLSHVLENKLRIYDETITIADESGDVYTLEELVYEVFKL